MQAAPGTVPGQHCAMLGSSSSSSSSTVVDRPTARHHLILDQHSRPNPSLAQQDNLLPISCKGEDWQGGMALTLVDALDALVLLGRQADIGTAVDRLTQVIDFNIDKEVRACGVGWGYCAGAVVVMV